MARAWELVRRPLGMVKAGDIALITRESPSLGAGEIHVRNLWLSVDPAMRALMTKVEGYMEPYALNSPMPGRAVGEVVESRVPEFKRGDKVFHTMGWRDEASGPASTFTKLPTEPGIADELWLGLMGMAGATAYFGLIEVGRPKSGETMFVSAAAGSVGSTVVQIGKILGLKIIGSAGGTAKCAFIRTLGADAAIDYKTPGSLIDKLKRAAPEGVDIYFDNVGGDHLDAALANARVGARFVECGMIQTYNFEDARQPVGLGYLMRIVAARITLTGFSIFDFEHRIAESRREMARWLRAGQIRSCTTVSEGLESAGEAFLGLFSGRNTGKTLIKL